MAGVVAALRHDGAQHAVAGAAERRVDGARIACRRAPHQRLIGALELAGAAMVGKGVGQRAMRGVGLGDHHDAAGVLVEAVDDARPPDAADAGQAVAAMMDQRVDQRAGPVAGAGMDDQPGRLVDDDDLGVLVENIERDRLALRLGSSRLGHGDGDALAGRDLAARSRTPACRRR